MAVLTPDSESSLERELAFNLVRDGRSPDEVLERLPRRGDADDDAALWLYSWAVAQQLDERPLPRVALPRVSE